MTKPGILFMPHGNLQYSQLPPHKRGWVARTSYGAIFDLVKELDVRIAFEASGETLEMVATHAPEMLIKLNEGIAAGRIEPVASPHTHIMLSNIRPEIGLASLLEGRETWARLCGVRPTAAWNPECSWASYIPAIFREAGFDTLIADADSYLLSAFEGIREGTGLRFDVRGHSNKNALFAIEKIVADRPEILQHLFLPNLLDNGLNVLLRSDMLCNVMLWYLMGATEGNREAPVQLGEIREMLQQWRTRIPGGRGFLVPYAEDAEYVGTTAYFFVKQFGLARFFEDAPESVVRFGQLLALARELEFTFIAPSQAVRDYPKVKGEGFDKIENGCAWHGGTAKAWANTAYSRILDPVCESEYQGLRTVADHLGIRGIHDDEECRLILKKITSAYVSDARWPPLPTSPGRFNVEESLRALEQGNEMIQSLMSDRGIANLRSLYSPDIMATQIAAVREELMGMRYFGE